MGTKIDDTVRSAVVAFLADVFGDYAYIEPKTVDENISMGMTSGFTKEDRSINRTKVKFLFNNVGFFIMNLIFDKEFRKVVVSTVGNEISLDELDEEECAKCRAAMNEGYDDEPDAEEDKVYLTINFDKYSDAVRKQLSNNFAAGLEKIEPFEEVIAEKVDELDEDAFIENGFIVCNFMYFLRAFENDMTFADYFVRRIKEFKKTLHDAGFLE